VLEVISVGGRTKEKDLHMNVHKIRNKGTFDLVQKSITTIHFCWGTTRTEETDPLLSISTSFLSNPSFAILRKPESVRKESNADFAMTLMSNQR
jgi:hypothetical protein